ncbi:MAG: hypothetical protein EON54_18255 [Alcaligenaceae bacterium]|nr:MAG: hypothetical protein EON54_18255 [Alcaligenaceae bacterium]
MPRPVAKELAPVDTGAGLPCLIHLSALNAPGERRCRQRAGGNASHHYAAASIWCAPISADVAPVTAQESRVLLPAQAS